MSSPQNLDKFKLHTKSTLESEEPKLIYESVDLIRTVNVTFFDNDYQIVTIIE